MKHNLNAHIMDSNTYLSFIPSLPHYERYVKGAHRVWHEKYPQLFSMCHYYNINIYPYLYTIERAAPREFASFKKFYMIYLKKADLMDTLLQEFDILEVASVSLAHLLALIFTIQYYFI